MRALGLQLFDSCGRFADRGSSGTTTSTIVPPHFLNINVEQLLIHDRTCCAWGWLVPVTASSALHRFDRKARRLECCSWSSTHKRSIAHYMIPFDLLGRGQTGVAALPNTFLTAAWPGACSHDARHFESWRQPAPKQSEAKSSREFKSWSDRIKSIRSVIVA